MTLAKTEALGWIGPEGLPGIHSLWQIGEESFRILLDARFKRQPASDITDADVEAVTDTGDFAPGADHVQTRTITIAAPPERVWPWLTQMLRGGGVYGWRLLEHTSRPSLEHLIAGLPPPRVGDRAGQLFELSVVEPPRRLAWRSVGPLKCLGATVSMLTLSYLLHSGEPGQTRLVIRTQGSCTGVTQPIAHYVFEALDFVLAAHQAIRLKNCVERRG